MGGAMGKTSMIYLSVITDSKLRFNEHAKRKEATKLRKYLHSMFWWHSKLPIRVKTLT